MCLMSGTQWIGTVNFGTACIINFGTACIINFGTACIINLGFSVSMRKQTLIVFLF